MTNTKTRTFLNSGPISPEISKIGYQRSSQMSTRFPDWRTRILWKGTRFPQISALLLEWGFCKTSILLNKEVPGFPNREPGCPNGVPCFPNRFSIFFFNKMKFLQKPGNQFRKQGSHVGNRVTFWRIRVSHLGTHFGWPAMTDISDFLWFLAGI